MWLYILAVAVLIFGIVGSVLSGGIFTIVLVPIGVIALISAIAFGAFGRAAERRHGSTSDASPSSVRSLPTGHSNTPSRPSTPDELTDARRVQQ